MATEAKIESYPQESFPDCLCKIVNRRPSNGWVVRLWTQLVHNPWFTRSGHFYVYVPSGLSLLEIFCTGTCVMVSVKWWPLFYVIYASCCISTIAALPSVSVMFSLSFESSDTSTLHIDINMNQFKEEQEETGFEARGQGRMKKPVVFFLSSP